jgi:AcrR family transcriptional regulator
VYLPALPDAERRNHAVRRDMAASQETMTLTSTAPKRETTDDRRRAIAAAARQLIAEKGFEGLRTRDIAARVGINVATLHYHVPTKEALIGLVAGAMREDFRAQSLVRPRAHLSPSERLEHEFYDFQEMFYEQRDTLAVMSELMERARRDEVIHAAMQPILLKWHQMVAAIFVDGVADGSFRADLDPEAASSLVLGALVGFARGPDTSPQYFERLCAELRRAVFVQTPTRN